MGVLYEHWRMDTNECFYVGKSTAKDPYARAHDLTPRNKYYKNIVNKLAPLGLIEIWVSEFPGITKAALDNLEQQTISHWKMYVGGRLTNIAKGGDGGDVYAHLPEEERISKYAARWERRRRLDAERAARGELTSGQKSAETQRKADEDRISRGEPTIGQIIIEKRRITNNRRRVKGELTSAQKSGKTRKQQEAERAANGELTAGQKGAESRRKLDDERISRGESTREQKRLETRLRKDAERAANGELTAYQKQSETRRKQDAERAARGEMTSGQKQSKTKRRNKELKLAAEQAAKDMEH